MFGLIHQIEYIFNSEPLFNLTRRMRMGVRTVITLRNIKKDRTFLITKVKYSQKAWLSACSHFSPLLLFPVRLPWLRRSSHWRNGSFTNNYTNHHQHRLSHRLLLLRNHHHSLNSRASLLRRYLRMKSSDGEGTKKRFAMFTSVTNVLNSASHRTIIVFHPNSNKPTFLSLLPQEVSI